MVTEKEINEIIEMAKETGVEITEFDFEELRMGAYFSCVHEAEYNNRDLEDVCEVYELNVEVANVIQEYSKRVQC